MLIYSPDISPRLKYTLDFVFRDCLSINIRITDIWEELKNHDGAKLNYSRESIDGIPFLEASGLLFEDNISSQEENLNKTISWDGLPAFYKTSSASLIPFDIFSAVFFLISRYEEYLPFTADQHNRFTSDQSIASRMGFLDKPIVDCWLIKFGKMMEALFPDEIEIQKPVFTFEATIDIDNAWAFKNKGFIRTAGSILKSDQSMERRSFRYQVIRGKQHDPFFQFKKMEMIHDRFAIQPKFFFLVGPYGKFDKNISPSKKAFRNLIYETSKKYEIGIHPSYSSNSNPEAIRKEKDILKSITGIEVKSSRQHYLKLNLPKTYQSLVELELYNDYTMGYADQSGFRSGTSKAVCFFDIENNIATPLRVYPFQVMDAGLRDYEKFTPDKAIERISVLVRDTKETGGTFRSLWHNESFSEWQGWEGWTRVYEEMLSIVSEAK